jgi:hypothetical protein
MKDAVRVAREAGALGSTLHQMFQRSFAVAKQVRSSTFIAAHSKQLVDRRALFAEPKPLALRAVARIKPSDAEVRANPRSRSAILRVAERTEAPLPLEHQKRRRAE